MTDKVGDIQPCCQEYHEERCGACNKGRTRGELHKDCEWCGGSLKMIVVHITNENVTVVEPYNGRLPER